MPKTARPAGGQSVDAVRRTVSVPDRRPRPADVPGRPLPAGDSFGVDEFVRCLADRMSTTEEAARWDASAVLTTVAEAVSGGEVNQVLTQLQSGYAELFGKPDLA